MKRSVGPRLMVLCPLMALALLSGCGHTRPAQFYLLSPQDTATQQTAEASGRDLTVGVGPVELPAYLRRAQIVTRLDDHRLDIAEYHRWAEPLEKNTVRVLAENLSALLGSDHVLMYPWSAADRPQYQVTVEIIHLDRTTDGAALLLAAWALKDAESKTLARNRSRYEQPAGLGYPDFVAAQSLNLAALSRDIADALQRLPAQPAAD